MWFIGFDSQNIYSFGLYTIWQPSVSALSYLEDPVALWNSHRLASQASLWQELFLPHRWDRTGNLYFWRENDSNSVTIYSVCKVILFGYKAMDERLYHTTEKYWSQLGLDYSTRWWVAAGGITLSLLDGLVLTGPILVLALLKVTIAMYISLLLLLLKTDNHLYTNNMKLSLTFTLKWLHIQSTRKAVISLHSASEGPLFRVCPLKLFLAIAFHLFSESHLRLFIFKPVASLLNLC